MTERPQRLCLGFPPSAADQISYRILASTGGAKMQQEQPERVSELLIEFLREQTQK